MGAPRSARAVGQALGRNPFPVVVPCHRVVGGRRQARRFLGARGDLDQGAAAGHRGLAVTVAGTAGDRSAWPGIEGCGAAPVGPPTRCSAS